MVRTLEEGKLKTSALVQRANVFEKLVADIFKIEIHFVPRRI